MGVSEMKEVEVLKVKVLADGVPPVAYDLYLPLSE
jgi:hypothetical protein